MRSNAPAPFGADAPLRVAQPLRSVYVTGEAAHLRAQEALRQRVVPGAVELGDDAVDDGGVDRASVRAVERAGGAEVFH